MAISLKHAFASAKSDGADATLVQPSNWNAEHTLTLATARLLGRTTAGTGAAEEISVGTGLSLATGTLSSTVTSNKPVVLFLPSGNEPPSTNYATFGTRNLHPTLDFDTTTQEAAIWTAVLPSAYAGGGLTVEVYWAAATATTGTIGWDVAIERIDASSLDIDADSFATAQTITAATVPGTSGQIKMTSVAITSGANMDSLAAGEAFRIRLRRDVANDTATGDAQMIAMVARET